MTVMLERVAQAISGSDDPSNILEIHRARARLAIEAMLEPTNKMIKAAGGVLSPGKRPTQDFISCKAKHRLRYRAMIEAALPVVAAPSDAENAA